MHGQETICMKACMHCLLAVCKIMLETILHIVYLCKAAGVIVNNDRRNNYYIRSPLQKYNNYKDKFIGQRVKD